MNADDTPPCPDCGGQLTEHGPDDDSSRNAYDCPSCGWGMQDCDDPLTLATAPWTRALWAEVERFDAGATELYREKCAEEDRADRAEREVARLMPLLADAERLVARLSRVLAVERGDQSAAPEGWAQSGTSWQRGTLAVWRPKLGRWDWASNWDSGTAPTALEAMEAADRAAEEAP